MKLRSNEPYWLIKNGLLHTYPSLREDLKTDVLIVGGGITGSLIAHQCIKDGFSTTLIDRREIAHGSTSATTSMLQYEIDVPLHELSDKIGEKAAVENYKACAEAIDKIEKIAKEVKSSCEFEKKDSLYFAAYKKDVPKLKKEFEARKQAGFPVHWLEAETIDKNYGLKNNFGGILSEKGASIDAFRLSHDILDYNSKKGLKIFDKTEIEKTTYHKNGVNVRLTSGFEIAAKKLIYCNGFESTEIIKENFVKLLSTFAIIGEEQPKKLKMDNTLFWNTADPYVYMRTTKDNRILIGGEDEDYVDAEKRDSELTKKAEKLEKKLLKYFPDSGFITDFGWAGTFGETKDGLPYIGPHKDFQSTYFVLGFGGNGITFSAIGMEIISDLLHKRKNKLAEYYRFGR